MNQSSQSSGGRPISRRTFLERVGAAGLGLSTLGPLVASCTVADEPTSVPVTGPLPPDRRRPPGPLTPAVSTWMLSLFPIEQASAEWEREVEISGWGHDVEEFVADGVEDRSYWASMMGTFYDVPEQDWYWDLYLGMVPFVEMATLIDAGLIEPWDTYLPSGFANTWNQVVKEEATYDGRLYSYPFGTNIVAVGWNAGIVEAAGLDPEYAPPTWDELIVSARKVMDSGAAPFGATVNANGWLSLAPIAHSINSDIYTEDGLFDFTHDAVVEALEILRRLHEVSHPEVFKFAAGKAAYYFDNLYAIQASPSMTSRWSDPNLLHIGALPSVPGGAGGTVFWSVGAGLFIDGRNKEQAAEYMNMLTRDSRLYRADIGKGRMEISLLQPYETVWEDWRTDPPRWLPDWVMPLKDQLNRSRPIPIYEIGNSGRPYWHNGRTQFLIGRPHWERYLRGEEQNPRKALETAKAAVIAKTR